jgi:hypothetical protein
MDFSMSESNAALVAYLEECARKREGAKLDADFARQLLTVLGRLLQRRWPGNPASRKSKTFLIASHNMDGSSETHLAVSQDERVARAIYAEAARRFPDSKITLAQGAGILEDSFHGTATPKRVLNAAPGPRLTA